MYCNLAQLIGCIHSGLQTCKHVMLLCNAKIYLNRLLDGSLLLFNLCNQTIIPIDILVCKLTIHGSINQQRHELMALSEHIW